jgi:hypothetical protein
MPLLRNMLGELEIALTDLWAVRTGPIARPAPR